MAQAYPLSPHFMDKTKESAFHQGTTQALWKSPPVLSPGYPAPGSLQTLGDSGVLHLSLPLAGTSLLTLASQIFPDLMCLWPALYDQRLAGWGLGKLPLALNGCMDQVKAPEAEPEAVPKGWQTQECKSSPPIVSWLPKKAV